MYKVPSGFVEPLESRIAPATIRIGAIGIFESIADTEYKEVIDPIDPNQGPRPEPFNHLAFTDTSTSNDLISTAVDSGLSDNTFYLRLQAGDLVERMTTSSNYKTFIKVKSGRVIAFFTDSNGNNEFDDGELTGLSLGKNTSVEISGSVNGDIITNLNEHGTADQGDDTVEMSNLVSPKQGITDLKVLGGSVFGSVVSGGPIMAITIAKNVENVLAGTAAAGHSFDFFTGSFGGEGTLGVSAAPKEAGASISNAVFGSVTDRVAAGSGGAGGKGGALTNIQVLGDTDGLKLMAGNGGSGDAVSNALKGGVGGNVSRIYIAGGNDLTPNSAGGILVQAGHGGDGISTGSGGAGGMATLINVGYEFSSKVLVPSSQLLADSISIHGGAGGDGKSGGTGGLASQLSVRVRTPDQNGNEIEVLAGVGGASNSPGGKAGMGGSVSKALLTNQVSTPNGDILIQAGDGGQSVVASLGAAGGSIESVSVLGFDLLLQAGNGSDGKIGGAGGSVRAMDVLLDDFVIARNVLVDAGYGGVGFAGKGGAGGQVSKVNATNGDFQSFQINISTAGNGGESFTGLGGIGGDVSFVKVGDFDSTTGVGAALEGDFLVRAGTGGDGTKGGAIGGSVRTLEFNGNNLNVSVVAGDAGNAVQLGKGAAAGGLFSVQVNTEGTVLGLPATGLLQGGKGGTGVGSGASGGAGGSLRQVSLSSDGDAITVAGSGGDGQMEGFFTKGGAGGMGGSIFTAGVFSHAGSASLLAGNAGAVGSKPAVGGSIIGTPNPNGIRGLNDVTVQAGNGSNGGQGGDILAVNFGGAGDSAPTGNVLIQAGDGSAAGKLAGRGGNLGKILGAASSGLGLKTQFFAGDGGSKLGVPKGGAGGSISEVTIFGGGAQDGELVIEAGDGGNAPLAASGARGGSISAVAVAGLDSGAILRGLAAGDGGSASLKGGDGGSIKTVNVQDHDIGIRTGAKFGFQTMGGLFAGAGGAGAKLGVNGSVSDVTAKAVASIVAGRVGSPKMAAKVSDIYVTGSYEDLLLVTNDVMVPNGTFQLQFGNEKTPLLHSRATVLEVQTALNALNGIAALGGVNVIFTANFGYSITFKLAGNQVPLTGVEVVYGKTTELLKGSTTDLTLSTLVEGASQLSVTEVRSGQSLLNVIETVGGSTLFSTSEQVTGDDFTAEVQVLDVSVLNSFPTGVYTLSYRGLVTGTLAANASAAQIETALNALPNIGGGVTVAALPAQAGRFTITFTDLAAQPSIIGDRLVPEIQRLTLGAVTSFANAGFQITFEGQTTSVLAATSTAAQVATALNALNSIQNAGNVIVTPAGAGQFDIQFGKNGDQIALVATAFVPELQRVSLASLQGVAGATFSLDFNGEVTSQLAADLSATQLQTALNSLPGIQATGGVIVTVSGPNVFDVVFTSVGDKVNLTGLSFQQEHQLVDLSAVKSNSAEFVLSLQHALDVSELVKGDSFGLNVTELQTGQFPINATELTAGTTSNPEIQSLDMVNLVSLGGDVAFSFAGQTSGKVFTSTSIDLAGDIQYALNSLTAIADLGGVTVVEGVPNVFSITFGGPGDLPNITGSASVQEVQEVKLAGLAGDPSGLFSLSMFSLL